MNMIDVNIVPHPFRAERERHRLPVGRSIAAIINEVQPETWLHRHAHVYLNGDYVPMELWSRVKPKAGTQLSIRLVPMGGGGGGRKNPLSTVLSLAVSAALPGLTPGISNFFGGGLIGRFAMGAFSLAAHLVINAIAPPPKPRFNAGVRESQTLFIQGARNETKPFGRVPKVLGRHRFVPPLGASAYTETVGNDQYLRMLFVWGYGPLQITDLKIGETPLADFTDVTVETREGYDDDAPITLYTNNVIQNDLQVTLTNAVGYVTRTTDTEADEISVDITFPSGLVAFADDGSKGTASVSVEIQYSPKGLNQWSAGAALFTAIGSQTISGIMRPDAYVANNITYVTTRIDRIVLDPASGAAKLVPGTPSRAGLDAAAQPPAVPAGMTSIATVERRSGDAAVIPSPRVVDTRDGDFRNAGDFLAAPAVTADTVTLAGGGLRFAALDISAKQSAALRRSVNFKVPRGQYDVRVRRITADTASDRIFDTTAWTALRTIRYAAPVKITGLAVTALRIKATDQLSGVIDKFNGVVQSVLPDWTGSAWVEQPTSNPASIFRHVLQGSANARPLADGRIDLAKLQSWHETCAASGRAFNTVIDYDVSVSGVLQDVAAVGRATPSLIDGKWAVVEDKPQTVPVQHFTPRNTYNFRGGKDFSERPQALRIRFINAEKGWLQDERLVFDDGYDISTATKYETLELPGITDGDQIWRDGRYHIAVARLRPETYSFYADVEHIVCTRGDLIRFTHDVPMFGLMSARVKSLVTAGGQITALTLDAQVTMQAGQSYAVRFRLADGTSLVQSIITQAGDFSALTLATPCAVSAGPAVGDLALFGISGQESVELIVKSIEPQSDLAARITCLDASPGVFSADTAAIPAWSSQISGPAPELARPPAPVLAQIQSGTESLIRHADGSVSSRIVITVQPPVFLRPLRLRAMIRAADETLFRSADILTQTDTSLSITDVADGDVYDIQLRYVADDGSVSAPLLISGYAVEGASAPPSDVTGFNVNILGNTAYLS